MTQDNFLSAVRAILTLVGSYLVGHAVFGHTVNADTWQVILGAVMTVASMGWSIYDKSATHDGVISALRQVALAIGGLFVSAGVISSDQLNSALGIVLALATIIQGYTHKSMLANISSGKLDASGDGRVTKSLPKVPVIAFLLIVLSFSGHAQSPFKREPKLNQAVIGRYRYSHVATMPTDSILNAWRFGVAISPAGFTFAGTYQAAAGIAYGFQHQSYSYKTQLYTVLWSGSLVWIPITTGYKIQSIKDIATFGALVGIKNNLIQVGPFVNPNAKGSDKFGIWIVAGINLN